MRWGNSGWPIDAATSFPRFLFLTTLPTFPDHPTVPSDFPSGQGDASNTKIIHVSSSGSPSIKLHYWVITNSFLLILHKYCLANGYDTFDFTSFYSKVTWIRLNPICTITNIIYPRNSKTAPPNIPSYFSMPTSPPPPALPNPQSTATLNHITAFINLMLQQMQ